MILARMNKGEEVSQRHFESDPSLRSPIGLDVVLSNCGESHPVSSAFVNWQVGAETLSVPSRGFRFSGFKHLNE